MNRSIELAELIKMMRESLLCEEKSLVIFFIKFANIILETNIIKITKIFEIEERLNNILAIRIRIFLEIYNLSNFFKNIFFVKCLCIKTYYSLSRVK